MGDFFLMNLRTIFIVFFLMFGAELAAVEKTVQANKLVNY